MPAQWPSVSSHSGRVRKLSGASFIIKEGIIPFREVPQRPHFLMLSSLGVWILTYEFWRDTNIQTSARPSYNSCSSHLSFPILLFTLVQREGPYFSGVPTTSILDYTCSVIKKWSTENLWYALLELKTQYINNGISTLTGLWILGLGCMREDAGKTARD